MEKYTNSNIKRATRIRHRRTNIMKLYTTEGETLLLLLLTATGNVLIDCDDKTLVILLEELRPLRLVSNSSDTAIIADEDVLDASGTTKLLDEELLKTADEWSSLFSLANKQVQQIRNTLLKTQIN